MRRWLLQLGSTDDARKPIAEVVAFASTPSAVAVRDMPAAHVDGETRRAVMEATARRVVEGVPSPAPLEQGCC